uniref:Uncharacterized protein n=1 Tax=Salarias fasciatus TaxID=181472 RepID=A0A672HFY9_SALFA
RNPSRTPVPSGTPPGLQSLQEPLQELQSPQEPLQELLGSIHPCDGLVPGPCDGLVPGPCDGLVPGPCDGLVPGPCDGLVPGPCDGLVPGPCDFLVPGPNQCALHFNVQQAVLLTQESDLVLPWSHHCLRLLKSPFLCLKPSQKNIKASLKLLPPPV